MPELILADGTVLENCECGYSDKNLWCFLDNKVVSFAGAFQHFSDPEKFGTVIFQLVYQDYIDQTIYSEIEDIISIQKSENTIDVRLTGSHITIDQKRIFKDGE